MARTDINQIVQDLQSDDGSVLWSLILGEQIEYPVTLDFVTNAYYYIYEAVLIEADNVQGSEDIPDAIKAGGIKEILNVRVPVERGEWDQTTAYGMEQVVTYGGKYYKLGNYVNYLSSTPPDQDPKWAEHDPRIVYIQFTSDLAMDWSNSPTASKPVYGFFELRVTEPDGGTIFKKTWKPVRGIVEFSFSPTELL